ncbi:uncharacterized protein [Rutidosis leptorrhynchoides]|uniref:uncharacterized protein n=1 Tax=Rutidosis leptorrhynchoides TaxID=125765 RepID=UPI003A99BE37
MWTDTSFWDDIWVGNLCFKNRFKRLYRLENNKNINIRDKVAEFAGNGLGSWAYNPLGRTGAELEELVGLVRPVILSVDQRDEWKWVLDAKGVFTVKRCSTLIDNATLVRSPNPLESLRNSLVPKKVEVFIWRARLGRIPVRVELDKRGIDLNSARCPICDNDIETVEHILFSCQVAKDIWSKVLRWWGYNSSIFGFSDIFCGTFGNLAYDNKKAFWQAVCWIVCYILWKSRNAKVFKNKIETTSSLLNEIQSLSFEWISRRNKRNKIDWLHWFSCPSSTC